MGVHAINALHGPLIVHPKGEDHKLRVDRLNGIAAKQGDEASTADALDPWHYEDERILFFKDGFTHPDALHLERKIGGLLEAVSKDDGGRTVGTSAWEYGTCECPAFGH